MKKIQSKISIFYIILVSQKRIKKNEGERRGRKEEGGGGIGGHRGGAALIGCCVQAWGLVRQSAHGHSSRMPLGGDRKSVV